MFFLSLFFSPSVSLSTLALSLPALEHADASVRHDLFVVLIHDTLRMKAIGQFPPREGWRSSSSTVWAGGSFPPSLPRLPVSSWQCFFFSLILL